MSNLLSMYADLPAIDRDRTALILLDLQNVCVDTWLPEKDAPAVLRQATTLLRAARQAGLLIVHVGVAFRSGYPEIHPRNALFVWLKESGLFKPGEDGSKFHASVAPMDDEPVVTKHRVGAFSGTELDRILRAKNVETLVLAGITTSGALLSAVRQAFDLDYRIIVARDCCADPDDAVHELLLAKVIAAHATITGVSEIQRAIQDS